MKRKTRGYNPKYDNDASMQPKQKRVKLADEQVATTSKFEDVS